MTDTMTVSDEVRRVIDSHVDEVEAILAADGVQRSERRTICDELECQIFDMLAQRCSGQPTVSDVKTLLAEIDSPSSFEGRVQELEHKNQFNDDSAKADSFPLAVGAAITTVVGITAAFLYAEWGGREHHRTHAAIVATLLTLLAFAMGATAIKDMRCPPKTSRGYLLAFLGVLGLPMVVCLWANREIAYPINVRLAWEVADYNSATRTKVLTPEGEIKELPELESPGEHDKIVDAPSDKPAALPFVPWIRTGRGVYAFSIATCFGPTILLSLILIPFSYKRWHPTSAA